jgi:carnitine O-acetyltransferase
MGPLAIDHESADRTFGNEATLPRVPLPSLDASCERFLAWCAPLLTPEQLGETQAAVDAFLDPDSGAHVLQGALEKFDACEGVHSWLDEFWPYRYLGRRDRIALNANFFFLFPSSERDQRRRAAGLAMAAVQYKLLLDDERVPPVLQRGRPLSMEQNKHLFSTTRIPGLVQDTVRAPYSEAHPGPSTARHILVFFRGSLFRLDVIGPDGRPHTLDEIADGLARAMAEGATPAAPGTSVGQLTTQARADWARNRAALLTLDPANAAVLDEVETALFCICLEDLVPDGVGGAADQLLHGDSANRWFDKAVSFVVFADGTAGINVEHCGLDGTTILSFVDTLLAQPAEAHAAAAGATAQGEPALAPLRFTLDTALEDEVRAAGRAFADFAGATATMTVSFTDFGAATAKRLGVSPDAFVQMAYQLAHARTKGFVGATYESIATRQWRRGRTEAMRVVTPEVVAFVAAMADPGADRATRAAAFRAAAAAHVARAKACQAGDAPEQHLWELQLIQQRRGEELGVTEPFALYSSPGWQVMRDDFLSTSSAPSQAIEVFGFGSTSSHCIGIGYVLNDDRLVLYLSTPRPVAGQMTRFADELRGAITELVTLAGEAGEAG